MRERERVRRRRPPRGKSPRGNARRRSKEKVVIINADMQWFLLERIRLKQSSFDFRRLPEDSRRASLDRFARFRLGREPRGSGEEIQWGERGEIAVVNIDAERKREPFLVEEAKEFCEIFLYPTQVTLSVSKKKRKKSTLHYV